jgi:hypothetical protein
MYSDFTEPRKVIRLNFKINIPKWEMWFHVIGSWSTFRNKMDPSYINTHRSSSSNTECLIHVGKGDNSDRIAAGYGFDVRGSITDSSKIFLFKPTQLPIQWIQRQFYPRVKRPGHETDYSLKTNTEVKNGEATPPLPDTLSWFVV